MNTNTIKVIIYLIGCILFSLGATSFIFSNMGTDPLDVFALGVQHVLGWKIGTTQSAFAIGCLALYWIIERVKFPPLTPFLTLFMCGYMIDFFRYVLPQDMISPYALLLIGVSLCTIGSAKIIMSSHGIRPMDLVAIALMHKTSKPFWLFKGIFEVLLLITGWLLGGPVGLGTVLFLVFVGWAIQPTIKALHKIGVPNFGVVK